MPPLFLPEIEQYAEKDPILYEILQRLATNVAQSPILAGNGDPNTDQVPGSANDLYIQTDPTNGATGIFVNGLGTPTGWQNLSTIINPSTPATTAASPMSPVAQKFMKPGKLILGAKSAQFDNQGRPNSAFFSNPTDSTGLPLTQVLTQNGVTTQINVASHIWQFGEFQMPTNSGSVDPGSFGIYDVFFDDIQYRGGVEIYQASSLAGAAFIAKRGRFYLGRITTSGGGGGTGNGGGNGGGRPGL